MGENCSIIFMCVPHYIISKFSQLSSNVQTSCCWFLYSISFSLSSGIIDLSQVPHLPVLVPPSAGPSSSPMDRITYIPGGSTNFPGRPYTPSSISPGTSHFTGFFMPEMCCTWTRFLLFIILFPHSSFSWVFAHKQDTKHIIRTWQGERSGAGTGPGARSGAGKGARTWPGERSGAGAGTGPGERSGTWAGTGPGER